MTKRITSMRATISIYTWNEMASDVHDTSRWTYLIYCFAQHSFKKLPNAIQYTNTHTYPVQCMAETINVTAHAIAFMAVAMYRTNVNETSVKEKGERWTKEEEKKQIWNRVHEQQPYSCMYIYIYMYTYQRECPLRMVYWSNGEGCSLRIIVVLVELEFFCCFFSLQLFLQTQHCRKSSTIL